MPGSGPPRPFTALSRPARLTAALALCVSVTACSAGRGAPPTSTGDSPPITATTSSATAPTTEPDGVPASLRQELDLLIQVTEEVRGLQFIEPPDVVVVSDAELEARVRKDLANELEGVEVDQSVFVLLGLLEDGTDLSELYLDLYGEQVAGFYDGDTRELVVPAGEEELTPLQRSTVVHELTHALTDQHFGMWSRYQELVDAERFDEATAMLGVIEGDAVLTEVLYAQGLEAGEQQDLIEGSLDVDTSALDATPQFIRDSLVFPYTTGFQYVLQAYLDGGHDAVNLLYDAPPPSTEELLDPGSGAPLPVAVEPPALDGYQVDSDGSWGALSWKLMFDQVLGGAPDAVEGWGGDRAIVYTDGENVVLAVVYAGDDGRDVDEMAEALDGYFTAVTGSSATVEGQTRRFRSDRLIEITTRADGDLVLVAADDPVAGERVIAALLAG